MTLKEKFRPHVKYWDCYNDEPLKYDHENKCVKIADDYAIEFLNYYLHNKANSRYIFSNLSAEESLEKFKQEKGL